MFIYLGIIFQTVVQEAALQTPPPIPSPAIPEPSVPPDPDPLPPPADFHADCVPLAIFNELKKDYEALENRFKATLAENRALRKSEKYYKEIAENQRQGNVSKQTSDIIFKKRLEPFLTETQSHVWVNNLKRPREWKNSGI